MRFAITFSKDNTTWKWAENLLQKQKGHQPACFAPLMASEFNPVGLSGAGYDDQYDNKDAENDGQTAGLNSQQKPACGTT